MHINGTDSSVLDSVFVSRREQSSVPPLPTTEEFERILLKDLQEVAAGGVRVSLGDTRCLFSGHIARLCAGQLREGWSAEEPLALRLQQAVTELGALAERYHSGDATTRLINLLKTDKKDQLELFGPEEVAGAAPV